MKPFSPYIGITDFMSRDQTEAALQFFKKIAEGHIPHKLMVGVMMSYKTLNSIDTKWSEAFPKSNEVADIFVRHPLAFNTLHYADYEDQDLANSLTEALHYGGKNIDAVQLDMIWPSPHKISKALRANGKDISVILQVGRNAIEECGDDADEVADRLGEYAAVVDGVLFDKSMGQGKTMDPEGLQDYIEVAKEYLPEMRIAVAGGLGPTTMHVVEPLIKEYPDISIDAQGKLRPSGNAIDPIDWTQANTYLREAVRLFRLHKPSLVP